MKTYFALVTLHVGFMGPRKSIPIIVNSWNLKIDLTNVFFRQNLSVWHVLQI